jgi:hypothetical protein
MSLNKVSAKAGQNPTEVPEPTTFLLMVIGLLMLYLWRRRLMGMGSRVR